MIRILFLALVGALIGWFTNYLAIKLIFRPLLPWRIPLIGYEFQGLIPKRRSEIAISIGETIAKELIIIDELLDKFIQSENKEAIIVNIKNKILIIVSQKLPSIIPGSIRKILLNYIGDILDQEMSGFLNSFFKEMAHKAATSIDIGAIVEEKINNFELDQLERIILDISKRELKHIEILGGVLGFIIGFIQGLIVLLL